VLVAARVVGADVELAAEVAGSVGAVVVSPVVDRAAGLLVGTTVLVAVSRLTSCEEPCVECFVSTGATTHNTSTRPTATTPALMRISVRNPFLEDRRLGPLERGSCTVNVVA